ncbi:hypothetical protein FRAHR75_260045 [Frankia sp. Hr75.2]|nr:hypothetical protein FRAHR75_260045 [Frankia sp. Hr75.2]
MRCPESSTRAKAAPLNSGGEETGFVLGDDATLDDPTRAPCRTRSGRFAGFPSDGLGWQTCR